MLFYYTKRNDFIRSLIGTSIGTFSAASIFLVVFYLR